MISYLNGILRSKSPTEIVVDVNGVGYSVSIPLSTFEKLAGIDSPVKILTYLHVREDLMQLFGFATETERNLFRLLITVSGIGPKMALGILSGIQSTDLQNLIFQGNIGALTAIPGVGRKTAERLIVELRDKIDKMESVSPGSGVSESQTGIRAEAFMALLSLGYSRQNAEKAIRSALQELNGKELSVQDLLKVALKTST